MPKKNRKLNWDAIARTKGYGDEEEMWGKMYLVENNDPNIMALILNCSVSTVWARLRVYNIRRGRGNISKTWGAKGI